MNQSDENLQNLTLGELIAYVQELRREDQQRQAVLQEQQAREEAQLLALQEEVQRLRDQREQQLAEFQQRAIQQEAIFQQQLAALQQQNQQLQQQLIQLQQAPATPPTVQRPQPQQRAYPPPPFNLNLPRIPDPSTGAGGHRGQPPQCDTTKMNKVNNNTKNNTKSYRRQKKNSHRKKSYKRGRRIN